MTTSLLPPEQDHKVSDLTDPTSDEVSAESEPNPPCVLVFNANDPSGAGDTLSGALAALLASGTELAAAATEALSYMDRCLDAGFRPGMGHVLPDRLFWAQPEEEEDADNEEADSPVDFALPPHDTRH
jgi:hypothetical protein